jgi:hypothetical protein
MAFTAKSIASRPIEAPISCLPARTSSLLSLSSLQACGLRLAGLILLLLTVWLAGVNTSSLKPASQLSSLAGLLPSLSAAVNHPIIPRSSVNSSEAIFHFRGCFMPISPVKPSNDLISYLCGQTFSYFSLRHSSVLRRNSACSGVYVNFWPLSLAGLMAAGE